MNGFVPLGNLCHLITKGTTPNSLLGGFSQYGINYIKSESLSYDGCIDEDKFSFIQPQTHEALKRSILQEDDVLISIAGANLGKVGMVTKSMLPANTNQAVGIIRVDTSKANPRFIQFYLRNPQFVANNLAGVAQSAQPNLNLSDINRFEIPTFPIAEQHEIAAILGALDDKIELNRRTAATLEAMARALYRSWFVDFDPVWAKAEGRTPAHMDEATAALFPDSFGDDGLPMGWREGQLNELVKLRNEKIKPSSETEMLPYIPIDCIPARSLLLSETRSGGEAQSSLTKFYSRDILFGAMRPYFHKVVVAPFEGTTRTTVFPLYPHSLDDFALSVMLLHDPETIEYATAHSTGSTIPYAKWGNSMERMPINIPPVNLRMRFNELVCPILDRLPHLFAENQTLATLRDTLLPKLVSGELRVSEAQELVEVMA